MFHLLFFICIVFSKDGGGWFLHLAPTRERVEPIQKEWENEGGSCTAIGEFG